MAIDRWLSPILDLARSLVAPERSPAPTPRPFPTEPIARFVPPQSPKATAPLDAADSRDADDSALASESLVAQEPVVSRAMAKVLAAQGHSNRALAMYDALLARTPGDAALEAEAAALREASAPSTTVHSDEDEEGLAGTNEIVTVRANTTDVLVSWQVDEGRIARGRKLLPNAESIAVRLVVFHRGKGREISRDQRERVVERAGEWLVRDVPSDAWLTASLGLRQEEEFVSLTHSSASRVS